MNDSTEHRDCQRKPGTGEGVEALCRSSTFRGPVEPVESHDHSNEHLALLYEDRDEQFEAVIPFVRDGLERGERCLYIADETSRETILERLRDVGVDVDEAIESGALVIHTVEETYMDGGTFDLEDSIALLEDAVEEGLAAFDGFRVTAEETWLLRADDATEDFMALESRVNELFAGTDATALCQYDRERFPASVLQTVIKTHPHLVHENTVSQNFYYTPPEAFFGDGDLDAKVDRMMRTLRDRTEAKTVVREHERYLRALYETTADGDLSFEEQVERLLELGCERFDLRGGALARLPTNDHNFQAEVTVGPDMGDLEGELPIQPTEGNFCRQAIEWDEPTAVPNVVDAGWDDDPVFEELGFGTYFGIRVTAGTEPYGTFWFYDTEPREEPFTEDERTFLELMGQWISTELERRRREEFLQRSYEITSNPDLSFEDKVERLLEHGRQWFGFDIGYLSAADIDADAFEIVDAVGSHAQIRPGVSGTLCDTYCQKVIDADGPISVRDAVAEGWEDDPAYDTYGLDSYLGTTLEVDGDLYGTLCFGSETPREGELTETEYTFLDLMSQWVSNELSRRDRERALRELYEITADGDRAFEEKVERLLDLGREQFGLDMGFFFEKEGDEFRVVKTRGTDLEEGVARVSANPGNYCKQTITVDAPVGVEDVETVGWNDDPLYQEYGLGCYLGTKVTDGDGVYGTVAFADGSSLDREFSDAEYTFLDLIGQWLSHELEQRQRETELRKSKEQFERIFENSHDAIYINDPHADEILDANEAGCEMLGYSYEELVSGRPSKHHPDEMEEFRAFVDEVYETGSGWTDELTCLHRDGTRIPVEMSASTIEYDGRQCLLAIVRDISDRKERERSQRRLYEITADPDRSFEEKLQAVLDLGCERFDMELGGVAKVDPEADRFEVEFVNGDHDHLYPGAVNLLSEGFCSQAVSREETCVITDPVDDGFGEKLCYDRFGIRTYLGTHLELEGTDDRTFWFVSSEPHEAFSEDEQTFHHLMGQWVKYELERRQREAELRESKEQLERIFERSHDAIYTIDPDADEILDVNRAACEMLGYDRSELLSHGPSDVHPDEMDRFRTFVDDVYDDGTGWTDELTCLHSEGDRIPVEMSASIIEYGGQQCMLAIVRDISERKERERELERAERQFEAVFNNPVSFVGLLDPDGTLRRANENALEFAGVEESDVRGEKFWEAPWFDHSEEIQANLRDAISRAANGEYVRAEIPHQSPDGETVIMDSMLEPVLDDDGEVVAIVPSGHDITELRERERFQRRLYEIVADPDRSFDEQLQAVLDLGCERFDMELGGVARVDPETDRFEVTVTNDDHEYLVPGESYPLSETYCEEPVLEGGTSAITDPLDSGFDGKLCYQRFGVRAYLGTYLELEGADDRTFWFVSTEPREEFSEAERTFHHLMGQWVRYELDRRQYERDLEETVDRLQQSNDRLKQFAYAASHDLQEPLRMVSSYLQLLENRYRDDLDAEAREFIDFAVDGADRMRAMVDDLLAFSRVEHADGEFGPVDCEAVLDHVRDDLQVRIEENDAEVVADEGLPTILADGEQLEQLFSNLVSNGIKYNESAVPRVEVSVADRGDRWEFAIADNGIGIESDKTDRIFEVFKRLHHDDEYPGTGVGLSLCQEIVDNHGGDIWVESERGAGSTFYVTLPKGRAD